MVSARDLARRHSIVTLRTFRPNRRVKQAIEIRARMDAHSEAKTKAEERP